MLVCKLWHKWWFWVFQYYWALTWGSCFPAWFLMIQKASLSNLKKIEEHLTFTKSYLFDLQSRHSEKSLFFLLTFFKFDFCIARVQYSLRLLDSTVQSPIHSPSVQASWLKRVIQVNKSAPPKHRVMALCEMPVCARAGDIMQRNCWITTGHRAVSELEQEKRRDVPVSHLPRSDE